jgi:CobQ-like glutamine amidotransferase family enzyme
MKKIKRKLRRHITITNGTYLRALQLLTKAYKAAKGRMPEGLDLLKLKQKARQKAIDSKGKVIQFPKDKITPFL